MAENNVLWKEALEGFIRSEVGRELSIRCVRAGSRPDVMIGGIVRSAKCTSFFEWVVQQSGGGVPSEKVMSRVLEETSIGVMDSSDIERECRETRFMRALVEEIAEIFFVRRVGPTVANKWFLVRNVDWERVEKMIQKEEYNLWHPRLCEFMESVVIDGVVEQCPTVEIPTLFLSFLCLYADVPIWVVRAYCNRNKELVNDACDECLPFLHFSRVVDSQHREEKFGAPSSVFRRQHDRKLTRVSSKFAAENEVFSYLLREFQSGDEWIRDITIDDYGQPMKVNLSKGSTVEGRKDSKKKARFN